MAKIDNHQVIAAFDFDETLITKDSLIDFVRFSTSRLVFLIRLLSFAPTLAKMILKRVSNQTAKERLLTLFFGGMGTEAFDELCERYRIRLDALTNPEALSRVKWHIKQGHRVVIISASAENWILPWAKSHGITEVIASRLEIKKHLLTGKLIGKNCHGQEKVVRFLSSYPNRESYTLYMYGDGKSDKQMFKLADKYYQRRFN